MLCVFSHVSKCRGRARRKQVLTRTFRICPKHDDHTYATETHLTRLAKHSAV